MLSVYPACFFKEEKGYSVIFPDLDWLATCGETLDEAMEAAVECLAGYLYTKEKEELSIPPATPIEEIQPEDIGKELGISCENVFVNMVTVDVKEYARTHFEKSVKKTLSIPAWLNNAAMEQNINFSQVLQEGLINRLKQTV